MGSTLQASEKLYSVYALSSQSLLVIRCLATEVYEAEIVIHQHQSGLETLGALSPLFDNLGNKHSSHLGAPYNNILQGPISSTFQLVGKSNQTSIFIR